MSNKVHVDLEMNVQGYQQGIQQATESTAAYETETRKVADAQVNLMKELKAAKKEVQNLAAGFTRLDSEAKKSAFGQEMARQLEEAKNKAAELIDLQGDLNTELKNMASDTSTLDALSQGMGVFMNVTSAALGAVAQFTGNEEDARKAVVAFTTAQSTLNALTQISNALQKQSALMLGVQKIQLLAAAAAARIKAAAETKGAAATAAATVAQKAFNVVANANPYVLLATAIIGVVSAFMMFSSGTDEATEKQKKLEQQMEETKKKAEEQRQTFLNAANSHYADSERMWELYRSYKTANTEIQKTAILEEAAEQFKKLGMEVNSASDAEKILTNNIVAVTQLMKLQGDAAGVAALRMKKFTESMATMMEQGYSATAARSLAGAAVSELDNELDRINAEIAARKKELKITSKAFGDKKNKKTTAKVEIKVEDGSLQKLKDKLTKLEEKKIKLNLNKEKLKELQKEIDETKKEIEDKEIELGIKTKVKEGSLEDISNKISEIDDKIKKLHPVIDEVEIRKLQMDKQALEDAKKEIEDKFKEVEIIGREFKSDAKEGSLQYARDKVSYYKTQMEIEVDDDRYQHWLQQYKEWKAKESALSIKIEADTSDIKKGSLEWLGEKKQKYQATLETSVVGSPEWKNALKNINDITKEEHKIQLAIEVSGMSALEKTFNTLEGFHAIDDVVGSFESLSKAIDENANAWEIFMAAISTVESVMAGINAVTQIANMLGIVSAGVKAGEATASAASTTATTAEAAAESAAEAPAVALAAANKIAEASFLDLASAMIFAAHASIPFAGVGIASSLIATMLSVQAATKATTMSMMAFAEGGIVGGSSYYGDRILTRLNSGEMVLNKRQQRNLFDLLDNAAMPTAGGTNVTVTGVVRGTDLMLVQKNTANVMKRAGNSIKF